MKNAELARLVGAQMCLHACMTGTRMATPLLALKLGYSPAAVGVLLALFSLMQVFLALPAGRYADRHGLRRPVRLAIMAAVSGALLATAFPVYAALCACALLTGAGSGAASIALQRHVGRASAPEDLKRVFSWLSIGPAISNFIGPFCAGLLIDHAGPHAADVLGFRWAFFALALSPLLSALLIRTIQELAPVSAQAHQRHGGVLTLLRERPMRHLMMVNVSMSACWDMHTFVLPLLGHERGLSASIIGTLLGSFAVAAACVRVALPVLTRNLRERTVITGAMVGATLAVCAYPFTTGPWTMGLCSVLLGLNLGCVQPMVMSMLHQITPEARHGEAIGFRLMALNASSVLTPMVFGSLGTALGGVTLIFWVMGLWVGSGTRLAWGLKAEHESA